MPTGLSIPRSVVIISNSGAYTASSATPTLSVNRAPVTGYNPIPIAESLSLWLDVTANTGTGGANNAWVEVQSSPDGGTTWLQGLRFTQISTSTAQHRIDFRPNGIGANEVAVQSSGIQTRTAAVTQNFVLSADHRIVWTLSTGQSLTFGVYASVQPVGSRSGF